MLAREFADEAQFFTLWVREAHPGGNYPQPERMEQREQYARDFCEADHPHVPVILDDMEGALHSLFGYFPNAVVILDSRGRVAYRANWTDHREVRRVLEGLRLAGQRRADGINAGIPRWSEEVLPKLTDDPFSDLKASFEVWESAGNFDEPERFYGPERAAMLRELYTRVTGRQSIGPGAAAAQPPP